MLTQLAVSSKEVFSALGALVAGTLLDEISKKPQREIAGSDAASRFDYQKDWAFCQLIRKHLEGENYLIAFEFHDDVLFLSPADQPTVAQFNQVKTSKSANPRKLSALTVRPKGNASILGKMCGNFDGICTDHDVRIVLVSNNAFEFADANVCAADLDEKFKKRLLTKLQSEVDGFAEEQLEKLHFHVSDISLVAMSSFLEGEAMELFSSKFGEDHGLNIRTWIRLLKSEIARKNNFPSDQISNSGELIDKKCVDHAFVESTLVLVKSKTRETLDVATILKVLGDAGWQDVELLRLQKKLSEVSADFYDPTNLEVANISEIMWSCVTDWSGAPPGLATFVDESTDVVMSSSHIESFYKQIDYLRALSVLAFYEKI
ncbi:hypothetical protein A8B75_17670 [Sphingomonadales bacterium EhC05]|nr:hypothetical protein A8B75_17670 [Sphingomonadales bacterium EhC05]